MALKAERESRQNQIVGRIFTVLGMKLPEDDEAVDELLAEWRDALADLTIDDIAKRVEHWKAQGRGCPADEFAKNPIKGLHHGFNSKADGSETMTTAEVMDKAKKLYAESDTSFEAAYNDLCRQRWGALPRGRK